MVQAARPMDKRTILTEKADIWVYFCLRVGPDTNSATPVFDIWKKMDRIIFGATTERPVTHWWRAPVISRGYGYLALMETLMTLRKLAEDESENL